MADLPSQNRSANAPASRRSASAGSIKVSGTSNQFKRLDDVLNGVVDHLGLDKRLREHTLMNLWPTLISQFFSDRSRALFIDSEGTLVIAVKNASTGQELTLLSPQLTPKLKKLAADLNLSIKGLRFELKHFHQRPLNEISVVENNLPPLPKASDDELFALNLSQNDQNKIAQLRTDLAACQTEKHFDYQENNELPMQMQERMIVLFEKQLRLAEWKRQHNFPLCHLCGQASESLHTANNLCHLCYFDSLS